MAAVDGDEPRYPVQPYQPPGSGHLARIPITVARIKRYLQRRDASHSTDWLTPMPRRGSNRRIVYDNLDYIHGRTITQLITMTGLERIPIATALRGMSDLSMVECQHRAGKDFWFRSGGSYHDTSPNGWPLPAV